MKYLRDWAHHAPFPLRQAQGTGLRSVSLATGEGGGTGGQGAQTHRHEVEPMEYVLDPRWSEGPADLYTSHAPNRQRLRAWGRLGGQGRCQVPRRWGLDRMEWR